MSLNCSQIEIELPILLENTFLKEKKTKIRSEKQKENDLKLGQRLKTYHLNKKISKDEHMKLLNETIDEIDIEEKLKYIDTYIKPDNNNDNCELIEPFLKDTLTINEKSDIDIILTDLGLISKTKTRGRPKKQVILND